VLTDALAQSPYVAILRGLAPAEAIPVAEALIASGMRIIEVPLNSPEPFESIRLLSERFGETCLIGAGTVLSAEAVGQVRQAGGRLIVMPHADVAVIRAAKAAGLVCTPGIATPTEGFAALAAGADALKLFPAELVGPDVLRAMRAVFPRGTRFLPVGGIQPETVARFVAAGAAGFGLGSGLYAPGRDPAEVGRRAAAYAEAWKAATGSIA
jgi:2-dehydro-3-deoxyphosphogalactonate aldolase